MKREFWSLPDEEMDFMPIIPLNESEGDKLDETSIPEEITHPSIKKYRSFSRSCDTHYGGKG